MDAGQDGCRNGRMLYRTDAGQDEYRTGRMQDRTGVGLAGLGGFFTGEIRTGRMQDRKNKRHGDGKDNV